MNLDFEALKPKIIEELNKRAESTECHMCHSIDLILVDGFFVRPIQKNLSGDFVLGGPMMPTIGIICKKCGHLMELSLGVLGLLPQKDKEETHD